MLRKLLRKLSDVSADNMDAYHAAVEQVSSDDPDTYTEEIPEDKYEIYWNEVGPSGIECPKCKEELMNTTAHGALMSCPPQTRVSCPNCGFRGSYFSPLKRRDDE